MATEVAIFKIGGKILDNSKHLINTIAQLTQLYEDKTIQKIILIPGGGTLANFVRNLYLEFKIDDELAHWIAIYSMNFNGLELQRKFPHLAITENFEHLKNEKRIFNFSMLVFFFALIYSIFLPLKLGTIWFYVGLPITLIGLVVLTICMVNYAATPWEEPITKGIYNYL